MKQSDVIIRCFIVFLVAAFCSVCFAAEPESFRIAQVVGTAAVGRIPRSALRPTRR
jgi:hypothetical protein